MKFISLDAVLAEIEKRIVEYKDMKIDSSYYEGMVASLEFLRDEFINSLEVKEVDLDKPFEGIKVQTSIESGSLDEVIVTTKYKAQKGDKV